MAWHPATIVRVLGPIAVLSCGGGKQAVEQPKTERVVDVKPHPAVPETEDDREKKRRAEALAIIPDGSACLPAELRKPTAPRLELTAIESAAVVCAIDQDRTRLLGPVGCWTIEVSGPRVGALSYRPAAPLPGRGMAVMLDDRCARGYCLPKEAKVPADPVALVTWSYDNAKVAVLAGDMVHLYDAATRAHESSFTIRGDHAVTGDPTAIDWNGDALFVEATDGTSSPVWAFKPDGTLIGPLEPLGGKDKAPVSTRNGSFLLLAKNRVAISEQGFSTLTMYDTDTGKRAKLVRKLPAPGCKKDELDALWHDPNAAASPKCKDFVARTYAHLIGADAVAGTKNLLVLLRGPRLGELAVIDAKTLAELKTIKMPWCDADAAGPGADKASAAPPAAAPASADKAERSKKPKPKADDPDAGGQ